MSKLYSVVSSGESGELLSGSQAFLGLPEGLLVYAEPTAYDPIG